MVFFLRKVYGIIVNKYLDLKDFYKLFTARFSGRKVVYSHYARVNNFGDQFNEDLINFFSRTLIYTKSYKKSQGVFVGSILGNYPREYTGYILGAGFLFERFNRTQNKWKILAIRGPLSAKQCDAQNVFFADPGILVSIIYPKKLVKKYKLGIIPNGREAKHVAKLNFDNDVIFINPHRDSIDVIEDMKKCEFIASSSLHGLVFADSFRIPNVHIVFTDKVLGGLHKFLDYYMGMEVGHDYIYWKDNLSTNSIIQNCKLRNSDDYIIEKQNKLLKIYNSFFGELVP